MRHAFLLAALMFAGCASDNEAPTGTTESSLKCFHTQTSISCAPMSGSSSSSTEDRTKIEDYYPSACFDGDADADGTPDFLDIDFLGSDAADADVPRDDLRCPRCNRGPGTQNDFRLRTSGTTAELDRGKVYLRAGNELTVPTPQGALTIVITPQTEIDDGQPAPGAEIRVEGQIVNGKVEATRLKVLCPAPAALPDSDVPPDAEPTPPGEPILL